MIGIYKITSPSGRVYIGQSVNIENRWRDYKKPSFINKNNRQSKIINSFKKYGVENHIFEFIEECGFKYLNIRERYWQEYYNVIENGLNCTLTETDKKPRVISDETKIKMGSSNRGKKLSYEQIQKIKDSFTEEVRKRISKGSEKRKGIKQNKEHIQKRVNYHLGAKRSEKTCINISNSLNHLKKQVYQFDKDMNIIKIYKSLSEVGKINGYDISSVSRTCKLIQKTSYGFIWRYEETLDKANYLKRAIIELDKNK